MAKVKAAGHGLVYAGYIGGAGVRRSHGIAVDAAGNAYVTGFTDSDETTFPVTVGPDLTYAGNGDAFVAKIGELVTPSAVSVTQSSGSGSSANFASLGPEW